MLTMVDILFQNLVITTLLPTNYEKKYFIQISLGYLSN
jgi:hypothetical protein